MHENFFFSLSLVKMKYFLNINSTFMYLVYQPLSALRLLESWRSHPSSSFLRSTYNSVSSEDVLIHV